MPKEYQIVKEVKNAQKDLDVADELIKKYLPYIRKEVYKYTNEYVNDNTDELSIAMIAFHEAIRSYDEDKGNFINYAAIVMRNRMIDYTRHEQKFNQEISLNAVLRKDDSGREETLEDVISSSENLNEKVINQSTTEIEIKEFSKNLSEFGISLQDVADNCPRQERTLAVCREVLHYVLKHREILDKMLKSHHLPVTKIVRESKTPFKTVERHRKYIIAILLIQTNGYHILRNHIKQVLKGE